MPYYGGYWVPNEEEKRQAATPPPPPAAPATAGTSYGVPGVNSGAANVGAPPPAPAPAPVAPAPGNVRGVVHRTVPLPPPGTPGSPAVAPAADPTLGETATGQFETPQQRQARELQLRAANEAIATIEGRTPSVALLQQQAGLNRAAATQRSQAAGAHGMAVAGARRLAARNIAELQQGAVGQAAEIRAKETADARAQLASIAQQVRGQDIDTTSQGAAALDRAKRNSQDYDVALKDLDLRDKLGLLQDERERAHLDELRRHQMEVERLEQFGRHLEAQKLKEEMEARNREFYGQLITGIATGAATLAGGKK